MNSVIYRIYSIYRIYRRISSASVSFLAPASAGEKQTFMALSIPLNASSSASVRW